MVWFDPDEFDVLPKLNAAVVEPEVSAVVQQMSALHKIDLENSRPLPVLDEGELDSLWSLLPAALGLPVEVGMPKSLSMSMWTWTMGCLLLVMAGLSLSSEAGHFLLDFGYVASEPFRLGGLTLVASFFLHVGWIHLLSNMYFLLVFGDNVEDYLGMVSFAAMLFSAHLLGLLFHGAWAPDPTIPLVGASGGLSGVFAFYSLKFPHARIGGMASLRWFTMPAYVYFIFWVGVQFLGVFQQLSGAPGASSLAHLGGVVAGIIWWWTYRNR